jgi:hypothetical protein
MHIERPSETHAGIAPWPHEERHCLESKKDSAPRSDRLMFDQRVACGNASASVEAEIGVGTYQAYSRPS